MPTSTTPASAPGTASPAEASTARTLALAKHVLQVEAAAVEALAQRLNGEFMQAVALILSCTGRVIVAGIGKSGHVGRKIAATLASTGTPAYFVHAAEAAHGDLGMITSQDVVIAISYSGKGEELLTIVPAIKRQGGKLIAMTGNANSPLAREADVHLDAHVAEEACPLNLAPTASTTAALALGDALAVALLDARGFGAEDFARSHPGGALGRRLLTHVRDVMRKVPDVPCVHEDTNLSDAILSISKGGMGMTVVLNAEQKVTGIFTDGDLRRAFQKAPDIQTTPVRAVMTLNPRSIAAERLAVEAARMMEEHRINQILVLDDGRLLGALNTHDLFRAKVI